MKTTTAAMAVGICMLAWASLVLAGPPEVPANKQLGTIFNSDIDGLLYSASGKDTSPEEYRNLVHDMLGYGMNVLAQNVGMPDPVIYRSKVATTWDKYITEVCRGRGWVKPDETDRSGDALKKLFDAGTDPLQITIEACRKKGVLIVASYRMNAEDFYQGQLDLYDFGRQHKHLRIPGANCLDPAHPEVYKHRMAIFREVAENYDIDGIEFDFRRWYHMVSDPLKNYPVLTHMVRDTRAMLDEVAKKKGRKRLVLGVRVGPSLDTPEAVAKYPGSVTPGADGSCKELGLDVKTWIAEELVDYVCPSLFWPRLPGLPHTKEFVELGKGKNVGIYPTVFPLPAWAEDAKKPVFDSSETRRRHRDEIVRAALPCYEQGADGISTFNWNRDEPDSPLGKKRKYVPEYGRGCAGYSRVNIQAHRALASRRALEGLLKADPPAAGLTPKVKTRLPDDNRKLGTIFNNDTNNILAALDLGKPGGEILADYRRALNEILDAKPGILAQNVGMPDPVIYRSKVATTWDKYHNEVVAARGKEAAAKDTQAACMKALLDAGTDPLQITIEACRKKGVLIVASYRMNAEDFKAQTTDMSDFGRKHKHLRIPGAHCLDPAHPEVYVHRMAIFREVAQRYDIDGIEFDFRRWYHMVSDPLKNYPVLTRMVRDTRAMLDEVAKKKGRKRLVLGVRVGPSLDTPEAVAKYPGSVTPGADGSCKELGLDVKTWIAEDLVDYVCPTLFWPHWPGHPYTKEFVDLAKGKNIGIYPTLFPLPAWLADKNSPDKGPIEPGDTKKLEKYKEGFCDLALKMYEDGADGISTFNWFFHLHLARMPKQWQAYYGYGMGGSPVQKYVLSILGSPKAIRDYRKQPWFWPPEHGE